MLTFYTVKNWSSSDLSFYSNKTYLFNRHQSVNIKQHKGKSTEYDAWCT